MVVSVRLREMPVSPVTPLRVILTAFNAGGIIHTAADAAIPEIFGAVIVLAPAVKEIICVVPGLRALAAFVMEMVLGASPVNVTIV